MSTYNNTVYYENWTYGGEEQQYRCHNGSWKTYEQAVRDMQNHANSWRQNGTGWIEQVTITAFGDNVTIDRRTVYENR